MRKRLHPFLRRYFSAGGRVVLGAASFSLLAGVDPFRTQLAGLFVVALALLLADVVVGRIYRVGLGGAVRVPLRAVAGAMVKVTVEITNLSRRPGYDLEATLDAVTPGLGWAHESQRCDVLQPGETAILELDFEALRRGLYRVGPAYAGTTYPLGIVRLGNPVGSAQPLLVTPRIYPMRSLRLSPGMRYQPGGVPLASQTGESLEFVGVRDYRQGDSLRKIHWKLWARRGIPVVREYSQEYYSRIGLILDTYRPPHADHFEAALESAASIANFLGQQDAIVDFFAAGPELFLLSMGRQLGSLDQVIEVLACLQPCQELPYSGLQAQLQDLLPRLSALLVVTFSLDPQRQAFLDSLRMGGAPLRVIIIGPQGQGDESMSWVDPHSVEAGLAQL